MSLFTLRTKLCPKIVIPSRAVIAIVTVMENGRNMQSCGELTFEKLIFRCEIRPQDLRVKKYAIMATFTSK